MLRAMILSLLGATFEVRLINLKSGRDIPGTRLFKGGYFKCRKIARSKKLKYGQMIRLQAVNVLSCRANQKWDTESAIEKLKMLDSKMEEEFRNELPPGMAVIGEASEVTHEMFDAAVERAKWTPDQVQELKGLVAPQLNADGDPNILLESKNNIGESNARQSDFMHQRQDEPNEYHGEDLDDHVCNTDGPMDWDSGSDLYYQTCTVCGEKVK